jgi:hypothetical protein
MKKFFYFLFVLSICHNIQASGISLYLENDVLFQKDFYYTHGTKITLDNDEYEYSIGQNMYTAKNKKLTTPEIGDRPYAGWLYFGLARHHSFYTWKRDTELDIGIVGPYSYAYQTQRFIHESLDLDVPSGWNTQVHNEPGIVYFVRYSKSLGERPELTLIPFSEIAIGNVVTYIGIGTRLQIGYKVDQNLDNQIKIKNLIPKNEPVWKQSIFQTYMFTGFNVRYVIYNIFLDGNTYRPYDYAVDRVPWVADFEFGIAFRLYMVRIDFTRNYRTKEFETEPFNTKGFDSVKLTYFFE